MTTEELVARAMRERWPFEKLITEVLELPEPERARAIAATASAIRDELKRRGVVVRPRGQH